MWPSTERWNQGTARLVYQLLQTYERRIKLKSLERLSDNVVRGTGAVLKNPLLLVGMMLISLLIKYPAEPDDAGR